MTLIITPKNKPLLKELDIEASDKSLSHRVCMLALFAEGKCKVSRFLQAEDTMRSLHIATSLGLSYELNGKDLILNPPKDGLRPPSNILYCGNSGTSMRLYAGLISGANLYAILCGDKYLHARPMERIVEPLKSMGANIIARDTGLAPLSLLPREAPLQGINHESNLSSAQVKSAVILAGLQASSPSSYKEAALSRDHTENLIQAYQKHKFLKIDSKGALQVTPFSAFECGQAPLKSFEIDIPNDPSSAFFFVVLAIILPQCQVMLKRVMLNKTRTEALKVLESMGATLSYHHVQVGVETSADILVKSSSLKATTVSKNIAWLIDEIPALSIAFSVAKGRSIVRNAGELRVKESDRIGAVIEGLRNFGIEVIEHEDGFEVEGGSLKRGKVDSKGDHRIAMSFAIAASLCGGEIGDCECINTSFPNFLSILGQFSQIEHA